MSRTKTVNEAPSHKYFTQMLNIAEDDLDPFQYRLLAHYVRWTGYGGESNESIRQVAKATKMGTNKVRLTLEELETLKYLKVDRPTPQEARNGKTIHITILDRWMDNISRYQGVSEKTQPVSNSTQVSAKPVSNSTHPPVLNSTRLKEQEKEEQKKTPRKRLPFHIKFPSNIKSYTAKHVEAYDKEHTAELKPLIHAWAGSMYSSLTEFSIKIAQLYIETHMELNRLHIPIEDYPTLIKYTRKKDAWKVEQGGTLLVTAMLNYTTDYKPKKIIQDDLVQPQEEILSVFQQIERDRKARENG